MDRKTYFLTALKAGLGMKRAWGISAFSIASNEEAKYPLQIVRNDNGVFYRNQDDVDDLVLLSTDVHAPIFKFKELCTILPGDIENYKGDGPLDTCYGNIFVNYMCLVVPFGDKIPYQSGYFSPPAVEKMVLNKLVDDPDTQDQVIPDDKITVSQYLKFGEIVMSMTAYNSISVTSVSRRSITTHPDSRKVRKELVEKHKDELTDPAIVAKIGKALEDLDRAWLAGDPTMDFYGTKDKKYIGAVRKKMHGMFGGESPFQDGTTVEFIEKSLEEGIDLDHWPAMMNSSRFGSFNRGAQTQLGGESTKTIYRMLGTVRIAEDDCKTTIGIPVVIPKQYRHRYIGYTVIDKEQIVLTDDNIDAYTDRVVDIRSPMVCKTEGRNVCSVCVGKQLSEQPDALAAAAAGVGGVFLSTFLSMMHASELATEEWSPMDRLN